MAERALSKFTELIRPMRNILALALVFALLAYGMLPATATANKSQVDAPQVPSVIFTNPAAIIIPASGTATPYPSAIVASGLPTSLPATPNAVNIIINGFSHTFPDDVGFVLVGPTGAALNISDGAGDGTDMVSVTYTISDSGAAQLPTAGAWGPGTYKPANYYSDVFPAPAPAAYNNPGPLGGGTATFSSTFAGTNPNGTWNLYIVDFVGGDSGMVAGGWSLEINAGPTVIPQHVSDYDGDGKTDPAVVRNTGGGPSGQVTWFVQNSSGAPATTATPWGIASDRFVPEDYDGDGKTDIAVWRSGAPFNAYFYILQSQTGTLRIDQFGQTADDPSVVGDYDGDGKADTAVYRAGATAGAKSNWYYRSSINGLIIGTEWGQNGDFPAPGDYDNDNKNDFVVQRNGGAGQAIFYLNQTTAGVTSLIFGIPTDVIAPGDYDGDLKTDIAVVRGSGGAILWNVRNSSTGTTDSYTFGVSASDFVMAGDWDGDGKSDIAVWRPNADPTMNFFYVRKSSDGTLASFEWGQNGDYPPLNTFTH
jgi:hypothetical protein